MKGNSYDNSESGGAFSEHGAGGPSADKISSSSGEQSAFSSSGSEGNTRSTSGQDSSSSVQPSGYGKPKGKNITEGSEDDFKGPSTQDAEIGSENDPGRRAESDFQKQTQQASGSTAPRQGAQSGETKYSTLSGDQEL